MEIKIKRFEELTVAEMYEILRCRVEVFVVEQGCAYQDIDGEDVMSTHLFMMEQGRILAYLRIIDPGVRHKELSVGRVLTMKEFRGRGLSRQLMLEAIKVAGRMADCVELDAQTYLIDFYKSLGFIPVSDEFIYESRPHVRMSRRFDGDMQLYLGQGIRAGVIVDAERAGGKVLKPVQTHSCNVAVIPAVGEMPSVDGTDALISFRPGLRIGVRTADCVPILLYAPDLGAVAAVHAGWKGSLGGITERTIKRLKDSGADPAKMVAAFGPSICGDCYEVSEELAQQFTEAGFADCLPRFRHIDLQAVNRQRLISAGLSPENIFISDICTLETLRLPSWRRHHTDTRLLTWIETPASPR